MCCPTTTFDIRIFERENLSESQFLKRHVDRLFGVQLLFPVRVVCGVNAVEQATNLHSPPFFFCLFAIAWATPMAHKGSQARGIARRDPSRVCNLHHSSWQRQILNPLSKARDQTHNLIVPSWIR